MKKYGIKLNILLSQKTTTYRSSRPQMFCKKVVLRKETLVRVFSCEFCKISKDTFFQRTPPVDASELGLL